MVSVFVRAAFPLAGNQAASKPLSRHAVLMVRIHSPPPASHMKTWFTDQGALAAAAGVMQDDLGPHLAVAAAGGEPTELEGPEAVFCRAMILSLIWS
jgi:hypothetical protein